MQLVFETYDAAQVALDRLNKDGRGRKLSVYRVFDKEGLERFVIALSPKQAFGESAPIFGLEAERWPRAKKETPQSIIDQMSVEQMERFVAELTEQLKRKKRGQPRDE